ncbi:30S ribosome-binding factor RbfA [Candidatus Omnitrophota bacterium]
MSRIDKLNEAFKREISNIISQELKDPRLEFVTINKVEVTKDLSYARVYYSVYGNKDKQASAEAGLGGASKYMRRMLGKIMDLRKIPELQFMFDNSIEYSVRITRELERIEDERKKNSTGTQEA